VKADPFYFRFLTFDFRPVQNDMPGKLDSTCVMLTAPEFSPVEGAGGEERNKCDADPVMSPAVLPVILEVTYVDPYAQYGWLR